MELTYCSSTLDYEGRFSVCQ